MSNYLPQGWKKFPLNEVCYFQEGPGLRRWQYRSDGYPFINIRCIKNGYLDLDKVQYISLSEAEEKYQHFFLNDGDYVLSSSGTLGRMAKVKKSDLPLMLNTSVIRFRSKDDKALNSNYLPYYLQSKEFVDQITEESQGSAQVNFGPTHLKLVVCSLPSLLEQKKIATVLTSVDTVIDQTQAQIEKLKDLKAGMLQELLTNGIGHTEFKDSPVGRIPAEWEVRTLVDCSEKMTNGFVGATRGIYQESGVPYVLCQNVKSNKFIEVVFKYVNQSFHEKNIRAELKQGDVLTVQTGAGNGDTCVVPEAFAGANCHALIITRLKKDCLNPFFFSEYMNSEMGKNRVKIIATGGAHPHLNTTDLRRELIPVPPIEEQNEIARILLSIQRKYEKLEEKNEANKNLKRSLMQDLLTGKVRVKIDS